MIKTKMAFLEGRVFPANQNNLNSFLRALIGWKKSGPPKKPLLFWSCKQAIYELLCTLWEHWVPQHSGYMAILF